MDGPKIPRRDFLYIVTGAVAAFGAVSVARPLIGQMSPAADSVSRAGLDVDVRPIAEGQQLQLVHLGRPIMIWHRTPEQIAAARADDDLKDLYDPATDESRLRPKPDGSFDPRYLVVMPVCTHFGAILVADEGRFDGFYCPAHGANFDLSGRIRSAPAPSNLTIPAYHWADDHTIKIEVL